MLRRANFQPMLVKYIQKAIGYALLGEPKEECLSIIEDNTLFKSDRIKPIPFNRHFLAHERDRNLKDKLTTKGPQRNIVSGGSEIPAIPVNHANCSSALFGVSSGIEPVFANYYERKTELLNDVDTYYYGN